MHLAFKFLWLLLLFAFVFKKFVWKTWGSWEWLHIGTVRVCVSMGQLIQDYHVLPIQWSGVVSNKISARRYSFHSTTNRPGQASNTLDFNMKAIFHFSVGARIRGNGSSPCTLYLLGMLFHYCCSVHRIRSEHSSAAMMNDESCY